MMTTVRPCMQLSMAACTCNETSRLRGLGLRAQEGCEMMVQWDTSEIGQKRLDI